MSYFSPTTTFFLAVAAFSWPLLTIEPYRQYKMREVYREHNARCTRNLREYEEMKEKFSFYESNLNEINKK